MRIHLTLPAVLAISIGAGAALLKEVPRTEPDEMVELADGVYFRHGDLAGKSHCNNGFVVFKDHVLVIDANFPSGAEACLADIRKVTDKPVRFVFDTHHHGDHAYGNAVWVASGAVPVAQENVVSEMRRLEPGRWREAAAGREDVRKLGNDGPVPPMLTFPRRMVLDDGERRVELLHFGTAHTRGDGFAYLPEEKILFTGDAVVNGPYNFMGDGNTESWLHVLEALGELDVELVAPGHGACGGRELIADQRAYISGLRRAVSDGIVAGRSVTELQGSVVVGEPVARYKGQMFKDQIAKIYSEMTGQEMPLELEQLGFREDPSTARGDGWKPPRKIVFTGDPAQKAALEKVAPGVEIVATRDNDEILRQVADADALIGSIGPEAMEKGTRLRWVHSFSAGVENYVGIGASPTPGIEDLVKSDVILTNGQRCHGVQISDQVFAFLLAFTRDVKAGVEGKAAPRGDQSRWRSLFPAEGRYTELRGRTMVVIGVGGIGGNVARRAEGFGMRVLAIDPQVTEPPPGVRVLRSPGREAFEELLPQADVLVLSCPLTKDTRGLIGREEIALLPDGAYFINVSRGQVADTAALVDALRSGKIAAAGLDVTEPEPLVDSSPLWSMKNVIITPHIGGQSDGSRRRVFLLVRENIRRFVRGEPLLSVVGKERGY